MRFRPFMAYKGVGPFDFCQVHCRSCVDTPPGACLPPSPRPSPCSHGSFDRSLLDSTFLLIWFINRMILSSIQTTRKIAVIFFSRSHRRVGIMDGSCCLGRVEEDGDGDGTRWVGDGIDADDGVEEVLNRNVLGAIASAGDLFYT